MAKMAFFQALLISWPTVAACRTANQNLFAWHSLKGAVPDADGIHARDYDSDGSGGDFVNPVKEDGEYTKPYRRVDAACGMTNLIPDSPGYLVAWAEDPGFFGRHTGARNYT